MTISESNDILQAFWVFSRSDYEAANALAKVTFHRPVQSMRILSSCGRLHTRYNEFSIFMLEWQEYGMWHWTVCAYTRIMH